MSPNLLSKLSKAIGLTALSCQFIFVIDASEDIKNSLHLVSVGHEKDTGTFKGAEPGGRRVTHRHQRRWGRSVHPEAQYLTCMRRVHQRVGPEKNTPTP